MLYSLMVIVLLVATTVVMHAFGTVFWMRHLGRRYIGADGQVKAHKALPAVTWTAVWLLILHLLEVVVWAVFYLLITPVQEISTFEEAVYFSAVTFTTLGYGDLVLDGSWRILASLQAANGAIIIGWTTALIFFFIGRIYSNK